MSARKRPFPAHLADSATFWFDDAGRRTEVPTKRAVVVDVERHGDVMNLARGSHVAPSGPVAPRTELVPMGPNGDRSDATSN